MKSSCNLSSSKKHYSIKKFGLILFLIVCLGSSLKAQIEWAPLGASWYYNKKEGGEASPPAYGYLKIEAVKDTVIEEQHTTVLHMSRHISSGEVYSIGNIYTFEIDSVIYIWNSGNKSVLYDFTKKRGETHEITGLGFNDCGDSPIGSVVVDSCGRSYIYGFESSYYFCSPTDTSIWEYTREINSIFGSVNFMFAYPVFCNVMDVEKFSGVLRCYTDDRVGMINLGEIPCDTLIPAGINNSYIFSDKIRINPNPCDNFFIISQEPPYSQLKLTIYSLLGDVIFETHLRKSERHIDVGSLPNGIYLLRIISQSYEYECIKFIKQ